ncbi:MAG: hypothetical protein KAV87_07755, partial [Desulfobacteraceae bacterium]|nr:hypothetical protein [Desulfobacteraceae bacterium]
MRIVRCRISTFLLKAAIISIFILWGAVAGAVSMDDGGSDVLRIIYSGALTGNIEPCGRPGNQAGGLSRHKPLTDQATKGFDRDQILILNAGNIIDRNSPFNHIASKYIMRILGLSRVEVMGIGPQELALGEGEFKRLIAHSPIHVVSANLPGILPYVRLCKNGGDLKVLVTSIIDPEVLKTYKIEYGGNITDPVSALRRLQREIDHDLFIVIVHAMGERISAIINGCPGIDLVVDGLTAAVSDNLDREDVIPLICNNKRGQYVNYVEYRHSDTKQLTRPVLMRAGVG